MTKKTESKDLVVVEKKEVAIPSKIKIKGKFLEPIATIEHTSGPIFHEGLQLVDDLFIPSFTGYPLQLKLYRKDIDRSEAGDYTDLNTIYILADDVSSLDVRALPTEIPINRHGIAVIVLVDSSSTNDLFVGTNVLVGISSTNGYYADSTLRGRSWSGEVPIHVNSVMADNLNFDGPSLPPGDYTNTTLQSVTFFNKEVKEVTFDDSTVTHCGFDAETITVNKCRLSSCRLMVNENIDLDGVNLCEVYHSRLPGIMLKSVYDRTEIDIASVGKAFMVRIDEDRVVVTLPPDRERLIHGTAQIDMITMSFKNPEGRRHLRQRAFDFLFGDNQPNETEHSVVDYLVDTIQSRMRMINLVDAAKRLVNGNLLGVKEKPPLPKVDHLSEFRRNPWTIEDNSIHGTSDKDTGNTIYVDGKF